MTRKLNEAIRILQNLGIGTKRAIVITSKEI